MSSLRLERMAAAGLAVWAAARLGAADRLPPAEAWTVPALSFTPQATVAAWACALLARDRGAVATAALAGTALTAALAPRAVPRARPVAGCQVATWPVLRVLTANLRRGQAVPGALVDLVRRTGADVLFVQELTDGAADGLGRAGLGGLLPGQRLSPRLAGGAGSGIYARYPLGDGWPTGTRRFAWPTARLDLPAEQAVAGVRSVQLVCVHLPTPKPWATRGAARWRRELSMLPPLPGPGEPALIVAGDFNATLDHARFRRLLRLGYTDAAAAAGRGLAPTWGPWIPGCPGLLTLDHVLADPRCAVGAVSVHRLTGSDHRALCADIRLPG